MRIALSAITAFWLTSSVAFACDDHTGTCEIEDWKHTYTAAIQALTIHGVATCDTGEIRLRFYDGEGRCPQIPCRRYRLYRGSYLQGDSVFGWKTESAGN